MNSWSFRRKNIILLAIVLLLTAVSFFIFWQFWYKVPTCFDNLKNGDELDVDCGGSCSLVCSSEALKPIIRWDPRLFEVLPGTWSSLVYVENPNIDKNAIYLPYVLTIFGDNNKILVERKSATILPKSKTVGIFEGGINIDVSERPKRALFEIGPDIIWEKDESVFQNIVITHTPILRQETAPRVEATVKNTSLIDFTNIELVISIFDGSDNAIAASRTFLENLKKE